MSTTTTKPQSPQQFVNGVRERVVVGDLLAEHLHGLLVHGV